MRLLTLPGVFAPISDSRLLADALEREPLPAGARVLDLCAGSGLLALTAARRGWRASAVDVSRRAVATVRLNAALRGLRVRARRGWLFEPVAGERFDLIVANPPYVPAEDDALPERGARRAWDAGRDGRAVLDAILDAAPAHLRPGGALLVTHSSIIGTDVTRHRLERGGLRSEVVDARIGPLGPLMRDRAPLLERRGLLPAGVREEAVVVIAGRA